MKKYGLLFLFGAIGIFGCNTSSRQLPVGVLSYDDPVVQMNFSEIADSVEIIRLETTDSVLLPEYFGLCMGKKYMVLEYSDALHQFSREGKYIRKILLKGRGPEEYLFVGSQFIDNDSQLYYMTDGEGHLWMYDLEKGKLSDRYSLPLPVHFLKVSKDTIWAYPSFLSRSASYPYSFCTLTTRGEWIRQLRDTVANGSMFSLSYIMSPEGKIRQKMITSDTIYEIAGWQKKASFLLQGKYIDPHLPLTMVLKGETAEYYFCYALPLKVKYNEKGELTSLSLLASGKTFRVAKSDLRSEILEYVYVDTLGVSIPALTLSMGNGMIWTVVSSMELQEELRKKAGRQALSPALEKLYREVDEEDNPLIVTGYIK